MAKAPTTKAPAKKAQAKAAAGERPGIDFAALNASIAALFTAADEVGAAVAAQDVAALESAFPELAEKVAAFRVAFADIDAVAEAIASGKLKAADEEAERQLADKRADLARQLEEIEAGAPAALAGLRAQPEGGATASADAGLIRLRVLGPAKGRRRAGFEFGAEPQDVEVTPAQFDLIKADPSLSHEVIAAD